MNRYLKAIAFSLMGIIVVLLIAATICEKLINTEFAIKYFYTAPWTIALWMAAVVSGLAYLFTRKMYRQVITCLLHFSFVVILGGAMITHLFGKQENLHLRLNGEPQTVMQSDLNASLIDFHLDYYPGTQAPMDYVSEICLTDTKKNEADPNRTITGKVSMNNIFSYRHYRFYQSFYDNDAQGTTLTVSYDPWGIGVTYLGYALLLFSMLAFFFQRRTHFRSLLRSPLLKIIIVALCLLPLKGYAKDAKPTPPTVQPQVAQAFGNLYVYYNNRVCPMSTLANDFTTKLYGKPSYKGLNANQVLCGWLFFYDRWADEQMIKIKGDNIKQTLGVEGKYARLNDFVGSGQYKLETLIREGNRNAKAADEKFQLVSMVCTGKILNIWCIQTPLINSDRTALQWYSLSETPPKYLPVADRQYMIGAMKYVALCIKDGRQTEADNTLMDIRQWQRQHLTNGGELPVSDSRFRAEQIYNSLCYTRPLAMACATIGIVLFIVCCLLMARGRAMNKYVYSVFSLLMLLLWLFLTFALSLRWIISGHVPLSNGFETMQFLAWVTSLITAVMALVHILKRRKQHTRSSISNSGLMLAFGYLIAGMTLMVSMMSSANPQITLLMPVLQSPLLTIHVAVIMIAYCLLAFCMLNGITAIILYIHGRRQTSQGLNEQAQQTRLSIERLQVLSNLLLYPAVFCLTIGIFIGAVWANISWGRYWGWDPKEVWALITMLVYALPFHSQSLTFIRRPMVFHTYMVLAFLAVLFTYFGVNFLLGGMHSYA